MTLRAIGWTLLAGLGLGLFLLLPQPALTEAETVHDYVGAGKCKRCHGKELIGDQYAVWSQGPHRRAFETLKSEASLKIAEELGLDTPPHEAAQCLECHVTGHGLDATRFAYELDPVDGVQCESCHGPGRDYRKKKIMSDRERAIAHGFWEADRDESICLACHNPRSPTFDPERYVLPDGTTRGFDFKLAIERIPHAIPADVKGRYVELEAEAKERKQQGAR